MKGGSFNGASGSTLRELLDNWRDCGGISAAAASVSSGAETLAFESVDADTEGIGVSPTTLFDAASLTKPFMATLALRLHQDGSMPLDSNLGDIWPGCSPHLARKRVEDLLRHRAGLRPWTPLYRRCRSQASAERLLVSGKLCGAAPGTYSDLDYALWGFSAERVLGASLWDLLQERALKPLGIEGVAKMPGRELDVVRCLCGNGREVELGAEQGISIAPRGGPDLGQPQDGNARFLGGLAGHAGLFVTTMGLLGLGRVWLDTVNGSASLLPPQEALRAISGGAPWAMGWARRRVRGSAGPALSAVAFGHVGFTGTSLWIDQERNRIYSLLAHRRQLDRDSNSWRRRFHALAAALPG